MPTGTFSLPPVASAISSPMLAQIVAIYDSDEQDYSPLPNVWCNGISEKSGAEPTTASFRYLADDTYAATYGWPSEYEQLFPLDAQGNYVVQTDDEIVVLGQLASGSNIVLFHGYAQIPQVDMGPPREAISFTAIDATIRLWDRPIAGRLQRDGDRISDTSGNSDYYVDLPCRFNPADDSPAAIGGYLGNATADNANTTNANIGSYPVFLEPLLVEGNSQATSYWYVSDAVIYLIAEMVLRHGWDQYVNFPTLASLLTLLQAQEPPKGAPVLNQNDAVATNIKIRDYDASNKAYPEVIEDLLSYAGFVMRFRTDTTSDGFPQHSLVISRRDNIAAQAPKSLYHAAASNNALNPAANNAQRYNLARDCNTIVNEWTVETSLRQVEATFYLAPLFQPAMGDQSNPSQFYASNLTNATGTQRRAYRWYGVDECGEGYWNGSTQQWVTGTGCDFSGIFIPDSQGNVIFSKRYRKGEDTLISKDAEGKPLKAVLEIQFGVSSKVPGPGQPVGDPTMWMPVLNGWQLLDDRLGIRVSINDPEQWGSGNPKVGDIRGITWQANPPDGKNFALRLTTVIDDDRRIYVKAAKRIASPTQFARRRRADAGDHFQFCSIDPQSLNYSAQGGNGTDPLLVRDDTASATTHAQQLRTAHEMPPLAGSVRIPWITDYYEIGDRLNEIDGRNASLCVSVGTDQGEAPSLPWIVTRTWHFGPDSQETILQLSDRRSEARNP